jgi:hypothetical protein
MRRRHLGCLLLVTLLLLHVLLVLHVLWRVLLLLLCSRHGCMQGIGGDAHAPIVHPQPVAFLLLVLSTLRCTCCTIHAVSLHAAATRVDAASPAAHHPALMAATHRHIPTILPLLLLVCAKPCATHSCGCCLEHRPGALARTGVQAHGAGCVSLCSANTILACTCASKACRTSRRAGMCRHGAGHACCCLLRKAVQDACLHVLLTHTALHPKQRRQRIEQASRTTQPCRAARHCIAQCRRQVRHAPALPAAALLV